MTDLSKLIEARFPWLTPRQRADLIATVPPMTSDMAEDVAGMVIDFWSDKQPNLIRRVPSIEQVANHLLAVHAKTHGISVNEIPAAKQIEIGREAAALSEDERLEVCPTAGAAPAAPTNEKQMTESDKLAADDAYLFRTFGDTYIGDPFKRRELLEARDKLNAPTHVQKMAQQDLAVMAQRAEADGPNVELSGAAMLAQHRAKEALKG